MRIYAEDEFVSYIPKMRIDELKNEEQNNSLTLLERIDSIVRMHNFIINCSTDNEENINYRNFLNEHIAFCSGILGINELQMLLFSYILNSNSLCLEKFANLLNVTRVQCFKYLDDLEILVNKRLIKKSGKRRELDREYWVPYEVVQALRKGTSFVPPRYCNLSRDDFFSRLKEVFGRFLDDELSKEILMMDFFNLLEDNHHLEFVNKITSLSLSKDNIVYLSSLCTLFLLGENRFESDSNNFSHRYWAEKLLINLEPMFEQNLIEYSGDDFRDKEHIILTKKAAFDLLGINETLHKKKKDSDLIMYESITRKELFYNTKEAALVNQLTELLDDKNYKKIKERLKASGMRTGFSCLFYGAPGTGKTETVLQIARMSGRDIMSIDISATKSHWFGESEKTIKQIFIDYQHKVKMAEDNNSLVPILMLNEADAIINKRKDTLTSGVAQTENAIQNVILEELEKLNGIMIATTNLIESIDKAFDRRFIYKIEFKMPDTKVRRSIWKNLIPRLSESENFRLAKDFILSGGQIENIARKHTINTIIRGEDIDVENLVSICKEESILKGELSMGFQIQCEQAK